MIIECVILFVSFFFLVKLASYLDTQNSPKQKKKETVSNNDTKKRKRHPFYYTLDFIFLMLFIAIVIYFAIQ